MKRAGRINFVDRALALRVEPTRPTGSAANSRGLALVLRGFALRVWGESPVLGARHLRRAALRLPAFGASGPHTARWGTCTHARGISLVLRGDPFALCPCPLAWLSQCIRTNDPLRGALPPVCDLPQDRCAEHVSSSWGTGCTTPQHGVCHPIPRPHH